jgi:hypothetical protein
MKPKGKPHPHDALTDRKARQVQEPCRYADGQGLYLLVEDTGARHWLLRTSVRGRRVDILRKRMGAISSMTSSASFCQYVILPSGGAEAAALWTVHAHAHDAATTSPILAITSPEMRCGKTTMLEILQALTPKSILTSNVTAPALLRLVDRYSPTLLVDESRHVS